MKTLSTFFALGRIYHLYYKDPANVMRRAVLIRLILPNGEDKMIALTMYDIKGFRRMNGFNKADQKAYSDFIKERFGFLSTGYAGYASKDADDRNTCFLARWQGQDRYFSVLDSKLQSAITRFERLERAITAALGDVMSECPESSISIIDAIDGESRSFRVHSDGARLGSVRHVHDSKFDFMDSSDRVVSAPPFAAPMASFKLHLAEEIDEKTADRRDLPTITVPDINGTLVVLRPEDIPSRVCGSMLRIYVKESYSGTASILIDSIPEAFRPVLDLTNCPSEVIAVAESAPPPTESVTTTIAVEDNAVVIPAPQVVVEETVPEPSVGESTCSTVSVVVAEVPVVEPIVVQEAVAPIIEAAAPEIRKFRDETSSVEQVVVGENSAVPANYKKPTDEELAAMVDGQKKEIDARIERVEKADAEKKEAKPSFWQRLKNFFKNIFG